MSRNVDETRYLDTGRLERLPQPCFSVAARFIKQQHQALLTQRLDLLTQGLADVLLEVSNAYAAHALLLPLLGGQYERRERFVERDTCNHIKLRRVSGRVGGEHKRLLTWNNKGARGRLVLSYVSLVKHEDLVLRDMMQLSPDPGYRLTTFNRNCSVTDAQSENVSEPVSDPEVPVRCYSTAML